MCASVAYSTRFVFFTATNKNEYLGRIVAFVSLLQTAFAFMQIALTEIVNALHGDYNILIYIMEGLLVVGLIAPLYIFISTWKNPKQYELLDEAADNDLKSRIRTNTMISQAK